MYDIAGANTSRRAFAMVLTAFLLVYDWRLTAMCMCVVGRRGPLIMAKEVACCQLDICNYRQFAPTERT